MKTAKLMCVLLLSLSNQVLAQTASVDCSDSTKTSSKDSTCLQILGHTNIEGVTKNFQASSVKPFSKQGKTCTTPWGQVIPDNSAIGAFQNPTGSYNYATGEYGADCLEEARYCKNGILTGSYQYETCTMPSVNATCGPAHGAYYTYPSSGPLNSDKCNPRYTYGGVAPSDDSPPSVPADSPAYLNTSSNIYSWTCTGELGGSSASCYAYRRINATCGSSPNSCSLGNYGSGTSTPVYTPYSCSCTYSWVKAGSPTIPYSSTDPNNGTYSSNGYTYTSSCSTCYSYAYTTYNWTCNGINGGSNTSCTVNQ